MILRELFESKQQTVGIIFGRFNPPHQGHRAAWEMASENDAWYVGTNQSTQGPKDPLPYDIKVKAMQAVWPGIKGHIVPETSWLTLASKIYKKYGSINLNVYTDEEWVTKALVQYNGKEGAHGFYNFSDIQQQATPRLSSATALRAAVQAGDREAFANAAGVPADTMVAGKSFFDVVAHYLGQQTKVGTSPKRPARTGARPARGHDEEPRYKDVAEGEIERQHGDLKPWAYWNSPERVAQKLYKIHGGAPISKDEVKHLWKVDGPDRMTKFMLKPDMSAILSNYEAMSAQGSLLEYGDTAKGQKMLTKVQKRAVDRVVSKKADTDPKYAKKNSDTANRAWDRMTDKDLDEARANTASARAGLAKRQRKEPSEADKEQKKSEQDAAWDRLMQHMNKPENMDVMKRLATKEGLGAYDDDKGVKHTRGSLLAKLEALPRGSDDFEWNRNRAIQHLKQGDTLRAKYYMMLMKRGEQGVAEGDVVAFPKKHRGDLEDTHDCPKCGGDLQGGTYMGHKVKVCMPCKQVYLPPNSGIDQKGNKIENENISRRGLLKGLGAAAAGIAAGDANAIAGAFPSPSTREKWAKDAAASNAAEARRLAAIQAKKDAERLATGTSDLERLNKINYHGGKITPTNAEWDGDSDFLDMDGTKYNMASRMPISGDEPSDMKLISTREGRRVYIWTRKSLKGTHGRYFYPAPAKDSQLDEFAPDNGDDREPNEEEILRQLASRWWLGTEQQMAKAQKTLDAMGWEIGPVESGDDDAGVFLIRPGDENGDTYIAFNHSDLSLDESKSNAMATMASRLANKDDGKVAKLRAAGDKRREDQLKGRDFVKRDTSSKDEWGNFKENLNELSTDLLGRYKKAAAADAKKADAEGDYERGNKRFKGINKATMKQFANDEKKHVTETALKDKKDLIAKRKALQDMEKESGHDKEAIRQRKLDLEKEARNKGVSENAWDRLQREKALECAGVGIITKQNSTVDVNKNTPKKNLKAFRLI